MQLHPAVTIITLPSPALVDYARQSVDLAARLGLGHIYYHAPTAAAIGKINADGKLGSAGRYALYLVVDQPHKEAIGVITLRSDDDLDHTLHLGYWLHPNFRKRGIMAIGLQKVMTEIVGERGYLPKIVATVASGNAASQALLGKLNFTKAKVSDVMSMIVFTLRPK